MKLAKQAHALRELVELIEALAIQQLRNGYGGPVPISGSFGARLTRLDDPNHEGGKTARVRLQTLVDLGTLKRDGKLPDGTPCFQPGDRDLITYLTDVCEGGL